MIPNIHIHEQLLFERCQERQREMAALRLAVGLRRERDRLPRRLEATVAGFVITLGSSLKQLEVREKQVTYDH
jgi:hypothetical protein